MTNVFFIVGPTATGKSELAADVALQVGAEIVSADAFQIYRGLDLLTAKPDAATLKKVRHHLINAASLSEEMNAEIFRRRAGEAIAEIQARGRRVLVVGGSGLYIKALTHGLSPLPAADPAVRRKLDHLSTGELGMRLARLDPATAGRIDLKNRQRLIRAVEICLLTGRPITAQRQAWSKPTAPAGVFVLRDRADLYARINQRVQRMLEQGVVEEISGITETSATAAKTLGLSEVRALLDGRTSRAECVAAIQQQTRRYAKRQLTWFRGQTSFEALNLSPLSHVKAVEWITARVLSLSR
jgi:tRNA dimethylallyltransferase